MEKKTSVKNTKKKTYQVKKNYNLTGEDIAMLQERAYQERNTKRRNVCDNHMDGA